MPEQYEFDYLVYLVSDNLLDEQKVWDMRLYDIYKRLIFKRFENWVQEKYMKAKDNG
ncbi:MAG: hypothetical protein N2043_09690 [Ignavibacterium sp.]|nr:hypothetical protein [Ignavibacterium sp.]